VDSKHPRIDREGKTIAVMIGMYCHDSHSNNTLCSDCKELLDYALECLNNCPFQEGKTVCTKCPVHCYKNDMRQKVRAVMRYSGPRMMLRHPFLTIMHYIDARRKEPVTVQNMDGIS